MSKTEDERRKRNVVTLNFMDVHQRIPQVDRVFFPVKEGKSTKVTDLYPESIHEEVTELNLKANLVQRSFSNLKGQVSAIPDLVNRRVGEWKDDFWGVMRSGGKPFNIEVTFEHLGLIYATEIVLLELKSFLDLFARAVGKLVSVKTIHTFGSRRIQEGDKRVICAGEKFLDALRNNAPAEHATLVKNLERLIKKNRSSWLDDLVRYRDTVAHYRTLATKIRLGSKDLKLPQSGFKVDVQFDGSPFRVFVDRFERNWRAFLKAGVKLLVESP